MNWDHLQVFLAVARQGQMLEASRKLGLNHATVARRIEALESALGTPLFHRRPNGSALTDAGEHLVPTAERVEAEILAAAARLRATEAEPSGTVRIGVPDGLGNLFLARELGLLATRYTNLVIELVPLPRSFSLSRREADLAIGLDRPAHGRLTLSKLTDYTLGLYAARTYLERAGPVANEDDLAGHAAVIGVDDYAYASALDYMAFLQGRARSVVPLRRCHRSTGGGSRRGRDRHPPRLRRVRVPRPCPRAAVHRVPANLLAALTSREPRGPPRRGLPRFHPATRPRGETTVPPPGSRDYSAT